MAAPFIGCCGWSEGRAQYVSHFPVVELQSTFYEPPSVALADKWRASVPSEFQFCVKAWQLITHTPASPTYRKLKSTLSPEEAELVGSFRPTEQVMLAWERSALIARTLDARVVLFQCPASFRPEPENVRNLRRFFSDINREDLRLAWEPRGGWPDHLVIGLCQELELLRCCDPLAAAAVGSLAEAPYWRLHGIGGYSYRYTDADLGALFEIWATACQRLQGPEYILFNNVWMKDDAPRFQRLLTR